MEQGVLKMCFAMSDQWPFMRLRSIILTVKTEPCLRVLNPVSHNLDFRFPLLINAGISAQFAGAKR